MCRSIYGQPFAALAGHHGKRGGQQQSHRPDRESKLCGRVRGRADLSEVDGRRGDGFVVDARTDAKLFLDALLDLVPNIRVLTQERSGVLLALTELFAVVRVPGSGLADQALLHTDVDQRAFAGNALTVDDVELGLLERRGHLVLDDLDPGPVAD